MLRRLFGMKPKPPSIPLEDRISAPTITDAPNSASTLLARVIDIRDADFEPVILAHDGLAVVDFWADWCQPCEIMSAYTAWLTRDYGAQLLVAALDVDENPATPEHYMVMGLPTLLFFRAGVEVDRQVGLLSYEELRAKVAALLANTP